MKPSVFMGLLKARRLPFGVSVDAILGVVKDLTPFRKIILRKMKS